MSAQNTGQCTTTKSPCGLTFWESLYFLFITFSTVGYGDKHPMNQETQITVLFIIVFGMAIFASFWPEVVQLFHKQPSYLGDYDDRKSSDHVIVSGYITTNTVRNFMREFLHPENENQDTTAVFLNPIPPPEELQKLMRRHFNYRCQYFQGSPLDREDLQRVKCDTAKACLVIANKYSHEPDDEDTANILRVISIKNFSAYVRVIIQILNYHNEHLFNVPGWNYKEHGDEVICINEVKLGLLGKSCLCPGFSTMMANLIRMSSFQPGNYNNPSNDVNWQIEYGLGASNELYTGAMSSYFVGKTFPTVAEICLRKLCILLIGVEVKTNTGSSSILFNPSHSIFKFSKSMSKNTARITAQKGIFIAQNRKAVKRAASYCDEDSNNEISKWDRDKNAIISNCKKNRAKYDQKLTLDGTGAYHWREPCTLDDATMREENVATLTDHIIVCIVGDNNSPTVGLRNLLLPLRSSNLPMEEVKKVLLLGQKDYIEKEWKDLSDFQEVYFMEGSPMRREDVISAGVQNCLMCLILSSALHLQGTATDPNLVDRETILSFLQIKGCGGAELIALRPFDEKPKRNRMQVPIILEIVNDSHVEFMEQSKDSSQRELEMALPFTRGQAFIVSILDAVLSLAFYDKKVIRIIRKLITGSGIDCHSQQPDDAFADLNDSGIAIIFRPWLRTRMSCRITQISLADERFSDRNQKYGELFKMLLTEHSMLALGLYRERDPDRSMGDEDRYVYTAPLYEVELRHSDKVFVLAQSDMERNFPLENTDNNDSRTTRSTTSTATRSNSSHPPTGMDIDEMSPPHCCARENDHTINLEDG